MKERLPAQMVRVDRHAVVLRVDAWEEWHGHYLWDCKVGIMMSLASATCVLYVLSVLHLELIRLKVARRTQPRQVPLLLGNQDHRIANRGFAKLVEHRQLPSSCCRYELIANCERALRCAFYAVCF